MGRENEEQMAFLSPSERRLKIRIEFAFCHSGIVRIPRILEDGDQSCVNKMNRTISFVMNPGGI